MVTKLIVIERLNLTRLNIEESLENDFSLLYHLANETKDTILLNKLKNISVNLEKKLNTIHTLAKNESTGVNISHCSQADIGDLLRLKKEIEIYNSAQHQLFRI
jgi:hypothetical protein